ncbi:MAG: FHA domain-containing protein [Bacteroidales bacterium]|nr:FHA domain-containing protein [Bacteroidales bacterium]
MEKIKVRCPFCSKILIVADNPANHGKKLTCPVCKQTNLYDNYLIVKERTEEDEKTVIDPVSGGGIKTSFFLIEDIGSSTRIPARYHLKEGHNSVGRKPLNSEPRASVLIETNDKGFSRLHFNVDIVKACDGLWHCYISNASNVNKTFVNGIELCEGEKIALNEGDRIESSSTKLCFAVETSSFRDETMI